MCLVSDCCGAYSEYAEDIDICPDCYEHCEFYDDEEDDISHPIGYEEASDEEDGD